MKKIKFSFKSIYTKFTIIFLGIWWLLNAINFTIISIVISNNFLSKLAVNKYEIHEKFPKVRQAVSLTFLISFIIGTIIILIAVRSIVKPIKRLSSASKEVAKGNFDIVVKVQDNDEIGQLTQDFNLMAKELKNIEFLRQDFVSSVSHEFKTPITSIKGFAKLIRDGQLSNNQLIEYSDIIINESERLSLLSSNLLKLSGLDSKLLLEHSTTFSLDEQIRKIILLLEVQWSKKEIDFDITLDEATINGDQHLLQEVWLNLIQNAIKFSNPNGAIKINLTKKIETVIVEISDNGIGIPSEAKERIFERFYKADASRSKEGNGLGLAIVKKIVTLSGGKISFESELGKGTTFRVELPSNQQNA